MYSTTPTDMTCVPPQFWCFKQLAVVVVLRGGGGGGGVGQRHAIERRRHRLGGGVGGECNHPTNIGIVRGTVSVATIAVVNAGVEIGLL